MRTPDDGSANSTESLDTDAAIVARVRLGQIAAFEALMRRYNQRLFRIARAILGSDAEAEDVVQQAYVTAYQHLDEFEGRAALGTWLTRIAIREATARTRRQRVAGDAIAAYAAEHPPSENASEPHLLASNRELRTTLEGAIQALPQPWRTVFVMRKVEGLSIADTAQCLGISEELVKIRLHRARARLRKALETMLVDAGVFASVHRFDGERCDRIVAGFFERLG